MSTRLRSVSGVWWTLLCLWYTWTFVLGVLANWHWTTGSRVLILQVSNFAFSRSKVTSGILFWEVNVMWLAVVCLWPELVLELNGNLLQSPSFILLRRQYWRWWKIVVVIIFHQSRAFTVKDWDNCTWEWTVSACGLVARTGWYAYLTSFRGRLWIWRYHTHAR